MSLRDGRKDLDQVLSEMDERLRRLERGESFKGTTSFGVVQLGTDIRLRQVEVDGAVQVEILRVSTGDVCLLDPGTCDFTREKQGVFSLPGTLTVSNSGRLYPPEGKQLVKIIASLSEPGTSETVVALYANGDVTRPAMTFTFIAGYTEFVTTEGLPTLIGNHFYQCGVVTVGTGAKDLVVQCVFA